MRSIPDFLNRLSGTQTTSPGKSIGTLTNPAVLQCEAKDEDGEIAEAKASSGAKEAAATVRVKRIVQEAE